MILSDTLEDSLIINSRALFVQCKSPPKQISLSPHDISIVIGTTSQRGDKRQIDWITHSYGLLVGVSNGAAVVL